MKRYFLSLVTLALVVGAQKTFSQNQLGLVESSIWTPNYKTGITNARDQGKDLLLLFTSTRDITICQRLDRDILQNPEFKELINNHFAPIRLEYSKSDPDQSPAEIKQNGLLKRAYRISGFPTILLTDTEGRPYGMKGYQPMKPGEFAELLVELKRKKKLRDEKFAAAKSATGVEGARLLAEGIPVLPGNMMGRYYRAQMEFVIGNDPENSTGAVPGFKRILADVDYSQEMERLAADVQWSRMIELTDQYILEQKLAGVEKQMALMNKFGVQQRQQDLENSVATLMDVANIDSKSGPGKQAVRILESLKAQKLQETLLK